MSQYIIQKYAKQYGWIIISIVQSEDTVFYDFIKKTSSGLTFCFTAEITNNNLKTFIDDILVFIDNFDSETYADEWLDRSVKIDSAEFMNTVADMDSIRSSAWLFVFDLILEYEMEQKLTDFPWWLWN